MTVGARRENACREVPNKLTLSIVAISRRTPLCPRIRSRQSATHAFRTVNVCALGYRSVNGKRQSLATSLGIPRKADAPGMGEHIAVAPPSQWRPSQTPASPPVNPHPVHRTGLLSSRDDLTMERKTSSQTILKTLTLGPPKGKVPLAAGEHLRSRKVSLIDDDPANLPVGIGTYKRLLEKPL